MGRFAFPRFTRTLSIMKQPVRFNQSSNFARRARPSSAEQRSIGRPVHNSHQVARTRERGQQTEKSAEFCVQSPERTRNSDAGGSVRLAWLGGLGRVLRPDVLCVNRACRFDVGGAFDDGPPVGKDGDVVFTYRAADHKGVLEHLAGGDSA